MARHTVTAVVSLVIFVSMLLTVLLTPVNMVAWSPGQTVDLLADAVITVDGRDPFPTSGSMMLTTVFQTRAGDRLRFPQAVVDYLLPNNEVRPYDEVYRQGITAAEVAAQDQQLMTVAQTNATVAALRQVQATERLRPNPDALPIEVNSFPVIAAVRSSGPANEKLQEGDIILSVNNVPVYTVAGATTEIRSYPIGTKLTVKFRRVNSGQELTTEITLGPRANDFETPTMGVTLEQGYSYIPDVEFKIDAAIGGNSAGLAMALAVYDQLTETILTGGRSVAATGVINLVEPPSYPIANLGRVEAIRQKVAAAESAGAEIILFPQANCTEMANQSSSARLIPVDSFAEAVEVLTDLAEKGDQASVPHC